MPDGIDNFPEALREVLDRVEGGDSITITISPTWTIPRPPPPSPWPTRPWRPSRIDQVILTDRKLRIIRTEFWLKPEWAEAAGSRKVVDVPMNPEPKDLVTALVEHFEANGTPDCVWVGGLLYLLKRTSGGAPAGPFEDPSLLPRIIKIGDSFFERAE